MGLLLRLRPYAGPADRARRFQWSAPSTVSEVGRPPLVLLLSESPACSETSLYGSFITGISGQMPHLAGPMKLAGKTAVSYKLPQSRTSLPFGLSLSLRPAMRGAASRPRLLVTATTEASHEK